MSVRGAISGTAAALGFFVAMTCCQAQAGTSVIGGQKALSAQQLQPGTSVDLTGEWKYRPGYDLQKDEKPELPETAGNWLNVDVPQFLNRVEWWLDDSEDFKASEKRRLAKLGFDTDRAEDGWYRMELEVPPLAKGQHLFVEFDGVAMKCRTYCNGNLLGEHAGMFSRFGYDLTAHLRSGLNVLAIYVTMERVPVSSLSLGTAVTVNLTASKVKTMSKGMFGPMTPDRDNRSYDLHGIWQPVRLVACGDARIRDVFFEPSLTGGKVTVESDALGPPQAARLKALWLDARSGTEFVALEPVDVSLTTSTALTNLTLANVAPKRWTPADPNLYKLEVTLETAGGATLDRWEDNVGFRIFEARDNLLYLNGKSYWLRGANQLPYGKNPWDPALARKLIQALHDANVRVTRTHATPWNEAWLDAADEIGLGVSIEGIRPWAFAGKIGATPPDLFQHWLMENEDVVRRCRNHPSVLIWTIGNEMLLRDTNNLEKWQQQSQIVRQTRALDPTRPVVCSSSYERQAKLYDSLLKPNNIDDGDIDDIHSYLGWYSGSAFVDSKVRDSDKRGPWKRPLIGQEMSTGYPDLDSGLPVMRYTDKLLTPQAWVGMDAYPGHDPAVFLEHIRAVSKRWAEQLRFQRDRDTAGFMLFSCECWFRHSYDSASVSPYPVVDAMRDAWAPVGLALETARRRFYSGEEIATSVFVTNDDEQFRDTEPSELHAEFMDRVEDKGTHSEKLAEVDAVPYYMTKKVPVTLHVPDIGEPRKAVRLVLRMTSGRREVSRSVDVVEIFGKPSGEKSQPRGRALALSLGPELGALVQGEGLFETTTSDKAAADRGSPSVILVGAAAVSETLSTGSAVRDMVAGGATCIVFSPGNAAVDAFPDAVQSAKALVGEFADLAPCKGTPIAEGLRAMDLKWWGRRNDWRAFVTSGAHRLVAGGPARELVRFIPAHGYIAESKVPEQLMSVLFQIPVGKGRLWVCDLDLEVSVGVDPAARLFAQNLLRAAADPESTRRLPRVASHEEMLRGFGPTETAKDAR